MAKRVEKEPFIRRSSWVTIIFVSIVVIAAGLFAWNFIYSKNVEHQEDIKFAKIEAYIDLVKAQLDKEIPEGKWYIEKYCDAPNTSALFEHGTGYTCWYGARSDTKVEFKTKFLAILNNYSREEVRAHKNDSREDLIDGLVSPIGSMGCNANYGRKTSSFSLITCLSESHDIRYELRNY